MQSNNIHLPALGHPTNMFAFDRAAPVAERLMNLHPLADAPRVEHWCAPGPLVQDHDDSFSATSTPHYQLLSLNIEVKPSEMRTLARSAYERLLASIAKSDKPQLLRFWNYVPQINLGEGDDEVYRQFCWGRSEAFETHNLALPAATAIGSHDGYLRIAALSSTPDTRVEHIENPRQLSAFKYPKTYGPRSPSFARATWVERNQTGVLLLSGTSSIVSHNTLHSGNLQAQVAETKRNIDYLITNSANQIGPVGANLAPTAMRFYLRDAQQLDAAQQAYQEHFPGYPAPAFYQADICRADLSMEIEGVFAGLE